MFLIPVSIEKREEMSAVLLFTNVIILVYLLVTLLLTYVVHRIPRQPVVDIPDWGQTTDARIPGPNGKGHLEIWRVVPDGPSRGTVVMAHGWGRNRDRMTARARLFGRWGFTVVLHSARDHGCSSAYPFMNANQFALDIEAVLNWVREPVLLYGHSAGAAGAIIAASKRTEQVRLLFLEGCYPYTRKALRYLYQWVSPFFGTYLAPMILFWMNAIYLNRIDDIDPARLAPGLPMPVMQIHGENDRRFPLHFAKQLTPHFADGKASLFIGKRAGHSTTWQAPGYSEAVRAFIERYRY